jgi:hypothetical protein
VLPPAATARRSAAATSSAVRGAPPESRAARTAAGSPNLTASRGFGSAEGLAWLVAAVALAGVFAFRAWAGLGLGFGFALCVTLCFAVVFGGAYAARAGAVDVTIGLGAAVAARWTSGDGVEATALGFVATATGAEATTGASGVGIAVAGFVGLDGFDCFDCFVDAVTLWAGG